MNAKQAKEKMKDFYLPTNWMRYYIYWRFPIGLIVDSIIYLVYLYFDIYFSLRLQLPMSYLFESFLLVLFLLYDGFALVVYRKMKRLKPDGYRYNQIFLGLNVAVRALGVFLNVETTYGYWEAFWMGALDFAVIALIWWLPNYIYFKKRKELFGVADGVEKRAEPELVFPKSNSVGVYNSDKSMYYIINVKDEPAASKTAAAKQENSANLLWKCEKCGQLNSKRQSFCTACGTERSLEQAIEILPAKVQRSSAAEE